MAFIRTPCGCTVSHDAPPPICDSLVPLVHADDLIGEVAWARVPLWPDPGSQGWECAMPSRGECIPSAVAFSRLEMLTLCLSLIWVR